MGGTFANFASTTTFNGFISICCAAQHGEYTTWMVDTWVSDYMTYDLNLFGNLDVLSKPVYITLQMALLKLVT